MPQEVVMGIGAEIPSALCVTGAAGFVGYNLTERLNTEGSRVIPIDLGDRLGRIEHGAPYWARDFHEQDLRSSPQVLKDAEVIIHLAALAHVDYSLYYPAEVARNNIDSTVAVLEAARDSGSKVVLVSSVEVYGGNTSGLLRESAPLRPFSPYGASKVAVETIAHSYRAAFGLDVTVLRLTNMYGPWQAPDRVIPRVLAQRALGIPSSATPGRRRDFMHVEDAIDAILGVVGRDDLAGMTYNVAANDVAEIETLVRDLRNDAPGSVVKVQGDVGRGADLLADAGRLLNDLGWKARRPLVSHLPAVRYWYANNRGWLERFGSVISAQQGTVDSLTDQAHPISVLREVQDAVA